MSSSPSSSTSIAQIIVRSLLLYMVVAARASEAKATENENYDDSNHHTSRAEHQQPDGSQDSYMNYVKQQRTPLMQVYKLPVTAPGFSGSSSNNNVSCNDGSPIGYYKRLNQHSKSWVIYLQGGGFCGSHESCRQRWQRSPSLMSSKFWPNTKTVDGILSSDPKENPYLWNANHIYVPYCSSDSWSGSAPASSHRNNQHQHKPSRPSRYQSSEDDENVDSTSTPSLSSNEPSSFAFLGSKIVERVFESLYDDLPLRQSLYGAKFILLAGDSAGATGVILNLDKMAVLVERRASFLKSNCTQSNECELKQSDPILRGLADSGWFLDNEPYNFEMEFVGADLASSAFGTNRQLEESQQQQPADCALGRCTPLQSIRQAMQLWNGQVPESCMQSYVSEPWRCYFGYRVYQTLRTPLFVVQWLYDEAQLMVDNIVRPGTNGQWNYVNKVVNEMRASLENVTALFAPSCLSHSLIARKSWNQININGFRLPHILNSWEEQPLILDNTHGGYPPAISSSMPKFANSAVSSGVESKSGSDGGGGGGVSKILATVRNPPIGMAPTATLESVSVEQDSLLQPAEFSSQSMAAAAATVPNSMDAAAFYLRNGDRLSAQEPTRNQIVPATATNRQTASTGSSSTATSNGQAKSRGRKRKRNNQQNRIKQSGRHRSSNNQQPTPTPVTMTTTATLPSMPTETGPLDWALGTVSTSSNLNSKEANDLQQQQQHHQPRPTVTPFEELMARSLSSSTSELLYGRVNRADQTSSSSAIRLGRSTVVDSIDAAPMLSNNVPDEGALMNRMQSQSVAPTFAHTTQTGFQDQSPQLAGVTEPLSSQGVNYGAYAISARDTTFGPDQFRFIDTCGWPQCNRDCPMLSFEFNSEWAAYVPLC